MTMMLLTHPCYFETPFFFFFANQVMGLNSVLCAASLEVEEAEISHSQVDR